MAILGVEKVVFWTFLKLRMHAKKIAHFLSSRDKGWGVGGRSKEKCLQKATINERFFLEIRIKSRKKSLIFEVFKTKGGGRAAICELSREDKI